MLYFISLTLREETFASGKNREKYLELTFANDLFWYFSREQTFANDHFWHFSRK